MADPFRQFIDKNEGFHVKNFFPNFYNSFGFSYQDEKVSFPEFQRRIDFNNIFKDMVYENYIKNISKISKERMFRLLKDNITLIYSQRIYRSLSFSRIQALDLPAEFCYNLSTKDYESNITDSVIEEIYTSWHYYALNELQNILFETNVTRPFYNSIMQKLADMLFEEIAQRIHKVIIEDGVEQLKAGLINVAFLPLSIFGVKGWIKIVDKCPKLVARLGRILVKMATHPEGLSIVVSGVQRVVGEAFTEDKTNPFNKTYEVFIREGGFALAFALLVYDLFTDLCPGLISFGKTLFVALWQLQTAQVFLSSSPAKIKAFLLANGGKIMYDSVKGPLVMDFRNAHLSPFWYLNLLRSMNITSYNFDLIDSSGKQIVFDKENFVEYYLRKRDEMLVEYVKIN